MRRRSWCSDPVALAAAVLVVAACKRDDAPADAGVSASSSSSAAPPGPLSSGAMAPASADASARAALAGMDAGRADAGPDYAGGECPDFDPDRWTTYEAFPRDTACWFFTPAAKEKLPRAPSWVPCAREELGPRCRKLALPRGEQLSFAGSELEYRAVVVAAKTPTRMQVMIECERQRSLVYLAADVDGAVFGALAVDPDWRCAFQPELRSNGWVAEVGTQDPLADPENHGGGLPPILHGLRAARGQLAPSKLAAPPPAEGPEDDKLLAKWRTPRLSAAAEAALGAPAGSKDRTLLVGTDGTDVVWSVGDRNGACTVFTSRYEEDPAQADATRVVELPCKDADRLWKVGCGWAGTTTVEGQALLVRLKDGMTFRVPKLSAPLDTRNWASSFPLAFSCSEVFVAAGGATANMLRFPLDALPGGKPAAEPPRPLHAPRDSDGGASRPSDAGAGH